MQLLENDLIRLRSLEPEDLDILYQWENDTRLWDKGDTVSPYSRYALKQFISESYRGIYELKQLRMMVVCKQTGETTGMVDIYNFDAHNKKAGIGIVIDETRRRQGLATQAIELIVQYAFDFLHLHQVYAYIAVNNPSSIGLFTNCGFTCSGTLTGWITSPDGYTDVRVYQRINNELSICT